MVEQLRCKVSRPDRARSGISLNKDTQRRLVQLGLADLSEDLPFAITTHDGSAATYHLDMMRGLGGLDRILESEITGGEREPSFTTHHFHPDNLTERYEVRKGRAYISLDGVLYEAQEGDVLTVPSMVLHQVVVPPRGYVRLLIVMKNANLYPHDRQHVPGEQHPNYREVLEKRRMVDFLIRI